MKKICCFLIIALWLAAPAQAFLYSLKILSDDEIKSLPEKELMKVYVDAKIESVASAEFVEAAGFSSAKDYEARKSLLRFIINLRREMARRGIEPEPIDDWLK